jgi:hypothetical protein
MWKPYVVAPAITTVKGAFGRNFISGTLNTHLTEDPSTDVVKNQQVAIPVVLKVAQVAPPGGHAKFLTGHRRMTENYEATATFEWATKTSLPEYKISNLTSTFRPLNPNVAADSRSYSHFKCPFCTQVGQR